MVCRILSPLGLSLLFLTAHAELPTLPVSDLLNRYVEVPFSIAVDVDVVHIADIDADGTKDLILEFDDELQIVYHSGGGFDFSNHESIPLPQQFAIWDLCRLQARDERLSILVLDSKSELTKWSADTDELRYRDARIGMPISAIHVLPENTRKSSFCFDIDADLIDELAIPTTHFLHLLTFDEEQELTLLSKISLLSSSSTALSIDEVNERVGQRYGASAASFQDINNDASTDVVVRNDDVVRITLGDDASATYFSQVPTYEVNFEKASQKVDFDSIDFSNLFSLLREMPNRVQVQDVNNDELVDLVILEPNRLIAFIATESGIDTDKPTQIMRFNENTVIASLMDLNDDETLDLIAIKTPHVSVRRVLLTLAVPTTLQFEFLVFPHSEGMFSRRPQEQVRINLKVPALVPFALHSMRTWDEDEAESNFSAIDASKDIPILDAQMDLDEHNEVVLIQEGIVQVYRNLLPKESQYALKFDEIGTRFVRDQKSRDEITIDVRQSFDDMTKGFASHFDLIGDMKPEVIWQLESDAKYHDLMRLNLNDDGLDELMIFEDRTEDAIRGTLLLSRLAK